MIQIFLGLLVYIQINLGVLAYIHINLNVLMYIQINLCVKEYIEINLGVMRVFIYILVLGTFPKAFSQGTISQGATSQMRLREEEG